MLGGYAIIDTTADPLALGARRRHALRRVGIPVVGVILTVAVILGIAFQTNQANRRGALALSDDVLATMSGRIDEEVTDYFSIAARALAEGKTLAAREAAGEPRWTIMEKFSLAIVRHVPQAIGFFIADAAGDFTMVWQNDTSGGSDTKLIRFAPDGARTVSWVRRDAAGDVVARENDPNDTYDARVRPWYVGALNSRGVFWTDVYTLFTANKPGITASTQYETPEGKPFVVGVDLTLERLSEFLAGLKIGKTGRAIIIDGGGRIIAHPEMARALRHKDGGALTRRVADIGDAPAARAFDYFRVNGPGTATVSVDGVRYLTTLTPLKTVGRDWSTMIVLPEDDFVGFVAKNNRTALLMSLAIVGLAILMAGLLIRQGLRTDRAARLLRERSHAMARQSEALDQVADEADLYDPSRPELPRSLIETAVEITGARRGGLWYLLPGRNVLRCADSFDSETGRHTAGFELHRDELPHFFGLVAEGTAIDVVDAASDPRTAEVHRLVMARAGSRSLSVTPMRRQGSAVGGIWLEDAADAAGAQHFLRVLASMAAMRGDGEVVAPALAEAEPGPRPAEPTVARSLSGDLALRGLDHEAFGDNLYPGVAVLVMRIEEAVAGRSGGVSTPEFIDAVACVMQQIAAEQDVPYLKLVGYDIIGAAGFALDDRTGAARIASTAVACRDRLTELFEAEGRAPDFRLGIDCGVAVGAAIGGNPRRFNLWGAAVQTARVMAESALPGSIQISEAAYRQLPQSFLLRPRGTFYLAGVGRAQTFVLAGQL